MTQSKTCDVRSKTCNLRLSKTTGHCDLPWGHSGECGFAPPPDEVIPEHRVVLLPLPEELPKAVAGASIGRIVHFRGDDNGCYAAIVSGLHPDDGSVDLATFGPHSLYFHSRVRQGDGPGEWQWPPRI